MPSNSNAGLKVALVAVVIAIFAVVVGFAAISNQSQQPAWDTPPNSGAATPGTRFQHGITVGLTASSPTNLALIKAGTCNAAMAATLAATTSGVATCTVTGAAAGDIVAVQLPAGGYGAAFGSFLVNGTSATTDGISFGISNMTGAATTSFPQATTSVQYQVYRTQ